MAVSKSRPQYGSIDTSNPNIRPLMIILWQNIYLCTNRNTVFVISLYMLSSKSRPQYGSIDTPNTNIRPLVTLL